MVNNQKKNPILGNVHFLLLGFLFIAIMENKQYQKLYNHLRLLYPTKVSLSADDIIIVQHHKDLFDYDATEFYGVDIDSFKLSKIAKRFSDDFYCEWETAYSQMISINI